MSAAILIQEVQMTTIRKAGVSDSEKLAALGAASFTETFAHLYSAENLARFLEGHHSEPVWRTALADPAVDVWIAEDASGRALAYMQTAPCSLPAPDLEADAGELSRLYVLAEAQGLGLGRALLDIGLRILEQKFGAAYLSVWSENIRAQRIYEARGFRKVADYKYMVGDHADDEWIMKRF